MDRAVYLIADLLVVIATVNFLFFAYPEDSWHRFMYYICGATFGGYVVFRYRQIRELLQ